MLLSLCGLIAATLACSTPSVSSAEMLREQDRERVYSALIDSEFIEVSDGRALIATTTMPPTSWKMLSAHPRYLRWQSMQMDRSAGPHPVSFGKRDATLNFVTPEERDVFFGSSDSPDWHELRNRYPQATGVLTLSDVVFDLQARRALVYAYYGCDAECAHGGLYEFEQIEGEWILSERVIRVLS